MLARVVRERHGPVAVPRSDGSDDLRRMLVSGPERERERRVTESTHALEDAHEWERVAVRQDANSMGTARAEDDRRAALMASLPDADDTTPLAAQLAVDARRRIDLQGRRFP